MELAFAMLADWAEVTTTGKVTILGGGIDSIRSASFPTVQQRLALAINLTPAADDYGHEHEFRLELLDPDGARLFEPIHTVHAPVHAHGVRGA